MEIHIESAPSETNPHLYVSLSKGRLQLSAANAIYSFQDKYDNFATSLQAIDWSKRLLESCLILGYGMGSIPYIFEQMLHRTDIEFVGIEKDESVVYLYEKYQAKSIVSSVDIVIADASAFVHTTRQKFDLICMDVFLDDRIPSDMQTQAFLRALSALLEPEGLLLYNRLDDSRESEAENAVFDADFRAVFPEGGALKIKGNLMYVNRAI